MSFGPAYTGAFGPAFLSATEISPAVLIEALQTSGSGETMQSSDGDTLEATE